MRICHHKDDLTFTGTELFPCRFAGVCVEGVCVEGVCVGEVKQIHCITVITCIFVLISAVLLGVRSLLDDPNPDDPLVPDIAALLKKNPDEYYRQVREAVLKYATPQHDSDSESDGS